MKRVDGRDRLVRYGHASNLVEVVQCDAVGAGPTGSSRPGSSRFGVVHKLGHLDQLEAPRGSRAQESRRPRRARAARGPAKPPVVSFDDHWHPIVDGGDLRVGDRGHDGDRPQHFARRARATPPRCRRPEKSSRRGNGRSTGARGPALLVGLVEPLEEPVGRDEAAPPFKGPAERRRAADRLGPRVDHPIADGAVLGPARHEPPSQRAEAPRPPSREQPRRRRSAGTAPRSNGPRARPGPPRRPRRIARCGQSARRGRSGRTLRASAELANAFAIGSSIAARCGTGNGTMASSSPASAIWAAVSTAGPGSPSGPGRHGSRSGSLRGLARWPRNARWSTSTLCGSPRPCRRRSSSAARTGRSCATSVVPRCRRCRSACGASGAPWARSGPR